MDTTTDVAVMNRYVKSITHTKRYLITATVFLTFMLVTSLTPVAQTENVLTADKLSQAVRARVRSAAPGELITVIVKLSGRSDVSAVEGHRAPVLTMLRQTTAMSQAPLINSLHTSDKLGKVGDIRQFWIDNLVLIKATAEVIEEIANRKDVLRVFANFTIKLPPREKADSAGPGETTLQNQKQLWDHIAHIGAKDVWTKYGIDGTGVRIGGLDTGVDISHPDIAGKMITNDPTDPTYPGGWAEFDEMGEIVPGSMPRDGQGHGTHTTGTMIGGNASGYDIGVAPGAKLMHGMVFPHGDGTFAQILGGMEWVIDPDGDPVTNDGAQIVNMSLGSYGEHDVMIAPVDNMVAAGVFPSIAIGNSGPRPQTTASPANVPSAFASGATDSTDTVANFSARGPAVWDTPPYVGSYIKPDICAPGVQVFSSVPGGGWQWTSPYGEWNGTSMATPHVSGTAALMLQANPALTVDTIKRLLANTAVDLGPPGKDNAYGWGRVDAFLAVKAALEGVGALDGTVTSSTSDPLSNVRVTVTNTNQRTFTDETGHYELQLVAGDHTVEFYDFSFETKTLAITVAANTTLTQDVTLTALPTGTIAGVITDATTGRGLGAKVHAIRNSMVVKTVESDPLTGEYRIALPAGTYDMQFQPPYPYVTVVETDFGLVVGSTITQNVAIVPAQILVVDDDDNADYEEFYETAIANTGRTFLTVSETPTSEDMAAFESVVWLTGDDYRNTLTSLERSILADYLDGGGRLFLSGQDVGYNIWWTSFLAEYLYSEFLKDDAESGAVLGVPESEVGSGLDFAILGGTGANNQNFPSEMKPIPPACAAFVYDETVPGIAASAYRADGSAIEQGGIKGSGAAGLTVDNGNYKLVFFSFGFEGIDTDDNRTTVMDRVLGWLQGYPLIEHDPLGDTEDTENPYRIVATIMSENFVIDPSTIAFVYDVGSGPVTVPMSATSNADEYEGHIPPQPRESIVEYYITASDDDHHTSTNPMGAPGQRHRFEVAKDTEAPVFDHTVHLDTNDRDGPYAIKSTVSDNLGLLGVSLVYQKNDGPMHRVKMTPSTDGRWVGMIPGPSEYGDVYRYFLLALDGSYSGNGTRTPMSGWNEFEIIEEFKWDFEAGDGAFSRNSIAWEWGKPTSGPGTGHSGDNVWATNLGGAYPSGMDAILETPPVALDADKPYAVLSFWHWYQFETYVDGGNVKISKDGGATWEIVEPTDGYDGVAWDYTLGIAREPCFTGYDNSYWHRVVFDLSAYAGETVILGFHAGSSVKSQKEGWYIDDVYLRSTAHDNIAPEIRDVNAPASTLDPDGPYPVTATVTDVLSGVGAVTLVYSTDGGTNWSTVDMVHTSGDEYRGGIPGQPRGTRVRFNVRAADRHGNEVTCPRPGEYALLPVIPSAPILVVISSTTGATLDEFRAALETHSHTADYWNLPSQGSAVLDYLDSYDDIIVDQSSAMKLSHMNSYTSFMDSGSIEAKKGVFLLGRDLAWASVTRPWVAERFRADYVQDDPVYREITGEPRDPIGSGETFVIAGAVPDEVRRSRNFDGGEIVYRFTGQGSAAPSVEARAVSGKGVQGQREEIVLQGPKSLDAAAGIKYNGETYRSVYLTFNFEYIQEADRRAGIADRVLRWLDQPEIVHTPHSDSEDTVSAYVITARIYSETLDPSRVKLNFDAGAGPVAVAMSPTGSPAEYSAAIPAQPLGTTVRYYLSASNTDGNTSYSPAGAPVDQHVFHVILDETPPTIIHQALESTSDVAGPYEVVATVTDNTGVDPHGVTLTWRKNGGEKKTVVMTPANPESDVYEGLIPGPSALGDVYEYFVSANDIAAVPNTARDPKDGYHVFEIVDFVAWDFEANAGGFERSGQDWEWGEPATGPGGANSGVRVWCTKLGGDYSSPANSTLDTPELMVPASSPYSQLSFWQWYKTEPGYDGGNVKISTDGGETWTILTPDNGYNGIADAGNAGIANEPCFTGFDNSLWHQVFFDLTPYQGQSVVVRWHFGSDASVDYAGWYIDDVRIEGTADTRAPLVTSIRHPSGVFDETREYVVSAVVRDRHSGVADVTLRYSVDDGSRWNAVAMEPTAERGRYRATIPKQAVGTRVKLYVVATDNASNVSHESDAKAAASEFGVMPSGDYLIVVDGLSTNEPAAIRRLFSSAGKTADVWDWNFLGRPPLGLFESYRAVVVAERALVDADRRQLIAEWLDKKNGATHKLVLLGGQATGVVSLQPFIERYTGTVPVERRSSTRSDGSAGAGPSAGASRPANGGLRFSDSYEGAEIICDFGGDVAAVGRFDCDDEARAFAEKSDGAAGSALPSAEAAVVVGYAGSSCASTYLTADLRFVQGAERRAAILDIALAWLDGATGAGVLEDLIAGHGVAVPDRLTMGHNHPNPFNPTTMISVGVPNDTRGPVSLKIYNVRGQLVKTLFEGVKAPGWYEFVWNGHNERGNAVASGAYFARFLDSKTAVTQKLILLK